MDVLLNLEEIDQRFMYPRMRVMASCVEQAAKSIFHRPRCCRINVGLHRRKMDNVLPEKIIGEMNSVGIDFVQSMHPRFRLVMNPFYFIGIKIVPLFYPVFLINRVKLV